MREARSIFSAISAPLREKMGSRRGAEIAEVFYGRGAAGDL
jgi:hypothetical protein